MVWKVLVVILLVSLAVGIVVERAVTSIQTRTIADVRHSSAVGGTVAVEGTVTFAKDNRFVIADDTGKAELSTCPIWYKRVSLRVGDKVTVVGEVMNNPPAMLDCDILMSVHKIIRGDEVIQVRGRPGKPPWGDQPRPASSPGR